MINSQFPDINIISRLSNGNFGTTYLGINEITKKVYVIKTQKISGIKTKVLDNKVIIPPNIQQELNIYTIIDNLKEDDKRFFNKLYKHVIHTDGEGHNQISKAYSLKQEEYEKSPFYIDYLLEYAGGHTLAKHKHKRYAEFFSIILQILKIISIFGKAGIIYNDFVHLNNLMICKTDKKYFSILGKKIQHYGVQVVLIDYGLTHISNSQEDMLYSAFDVINLLLIKCASWRVRMPWQSYHGNDIKLFNAVPKIVLKYSALFNENINLMVQHVKAEVVFTMPDIYKKYYSGSCKKLYVNVTNQVYLDFLEVNTFKNMVEFWLKYYLEVA
jgi:serine/threonine protein kinase